VSSERAKILLSEIMTRLPGYLVPKLVQEIAGQAHKTPII
jgi:L-lysine 2,3-aminomutase